MILILRFYLWITRVVTVKLFYFVFIFIYLLEFSLQRAKERLEEARRQRGVPDSVKLARRQELQKKLQITSIASSQVGDSRPLTFIQFSPNSKMLATSSW